MLELILTKPERRWIKRWQLRRKLKKLNRELNKGRVPFKINPIANEK